MATAKVMRPGKTAKDHKSGAWGNRFVNRDLRTAWMQDAKTAFPIGTCNGKKNRRRWTGKGNLTIVK